MIRAKDESLQELDDVRPRDVEGYSRIVVKILQSERGGEVREVRAVSVASVARGARLHLITSDYL